MSYEKPNLGGVRDNLYEDMCMMNNLLCYIW